MSRNTIGLIWLAGLVLAVLLTVIGPGSLGTALGSAFDRAIDAITLTLTQAGEPVRETVRGFAIAVYVVFIALCVLARRRRLPSMTAAVVVTLLFLFLAGSPHEWGRSLYAGHWFLALLLSLAGALLMTRRLISGTPGDSPGRRF
jgi:hypothetical protein